MKVSPRRALLLLAPVVAAGVVLGWWRGALRVRETRRELARLEERRNELEESRRRLEREVEALKREREAKVRAAREALDLAAPDEVLVILPPPHPTPGSGVRTPGSQPPPTQGTGTKG